MSSLEVRPVSGHTGADILGVDLKQRLSDEEVATIRAALLRWKVVFFREQHLTPSEQAAFARRFGQPTPAHPLRDSIEGHPEVLPIDRRIFDEEYGDKNARRDINGWHTDVTAVVNPPAGSILRAEEVPPYGGDTTWTNLVAAYEGLSAPFKRFADRLRAVHSFQLPDGVAVGTKWRERIEQKPLVSEHPVVRVHPETGERALFVSPTFIRYIVGVTPDESQRIINLFFQQITRPEYTVRFRWQKGSIAFWDNRATSHLGPQDIDHIEHERKLHRITLVGDIPVGVDGVPSRSIQGEPLLAAS
ncbi:MAG TPA: TauD/TfdA family dioxygenase [Polyangiaceae bacterium]|nr:TauD/TfdA family dioxygenase [Polyangiaceae bacterium]